MTAVPLPWCQQVTFPLEHGDMMVHGFMRAYHRWIPGVARVQVLMIGTMANGEQQWLVEERYGVEDQYDEVFFPGTEEGKAFAWFLNTAVNLSEGSDEYFQRVVETRMAGIAQRRKSGSST